MDWQEAYKQLRDLEAELNVREEEMERNAIDLLKRIELYATIALEVRLIVQSWKSLPENQKMYYVNQKQIQEIETPKKRKYRVSRYNIDGGKKNGPPDGRP